MKIKDLNIRGTRVNQLNTLNSMKNLIKIEVNEDTSTILDTLMSLSHKDQALINRTQISKLRHLYRRKILQMKQK